MDVLLNWLWQGCVVTLATIAILKLLRGLDARLRYCVWWAALLMVVVLPIIRAFSAAIPPEGVMGASAGQRVAPVVSLPEGPSGSGTVLVLLWAMWITLFSGRVAGAVLALRRAKTSCRQIPFILEARLRHWTLVKVQGRRTRLVVSDRVRSAAVLGIGSPLIAVAPTLLEHLNDHELDRIVVHEWAHVQRRDDVANLIQLLVCVAAGWHPAVWWIDRQLHIEREVSCDEIVVAITGSPKAYAACLVRLAGLPLVPLASLPAPGALSSSGVGKRIVRVLNSRPVPSTKRSVLAATAAAALLSAVALWTGTLQLVATAGPMVTTLDISQASLPAIASAHPSPSLGAAQPGNEPSRGAAQDLETRRARPAEQRGTRRSLAPRPIRSSRPQISDDSGISVFSNAQIVAAVDSSAAPPVAVSQPPLSLIAELPSHSLDLSPPIESPVGNTRPVSPWGTAAAAGVAVGRGFQKAALTTAGSFSKFGKKIAGSF